MKKFIFLILFISLNSLAQNQWNSFGNIAGDAPLAGSGFSSPIVYLDNISQLKIDKNGVPIFAFIDRNNKILVRKYISPSWITIGDVNNITQNNVSDIDLEINANNEYILVYSDVNSVPERRPVIKKFSNNQWQTIGNDYAYSLGTLKNDIELDTNNNIHFAFIDSAKKISLLKYTSLWENVGPPNYGLLANEINTFMLKLSASNIPYVFYQEQGGSTFGGNGVLQNGLYVLKVNQLNWEILGGGIGGGITNSNGCCNYADFVVFNETPVVLYNQNNGFAKVRAIYFSNGSWIFMGNQLGVNGWMPGRNKLSVHNNELYAFHREHSNGYDLRKFNSISNQWELQNSLFPISSYLISNVGNISFEFNTQGNPFIAYNSGQDKYVTHFYGITTLLSVSDFKQSNVSLHPNPVLDYVTIQNDNNLEIQKISVIDLNGRVVKEIKYNSLQNGLLDIASLEKGLYILNITTENNQVLSKKIIKK